MPALLLSARGAYGDAIRVGLARKGFNDIPRNGAFVLGGVGNHGASLADAVRGLRVSKQASSQLVEHLVMRGYLDRRPDPRDRRRMNVTLTDRGKAAAEAIRGAVVSVDELLAGKLSPQGVQALRIGLQALSEIALGAEGNP